MHLGIDFDNTLVCYDQLFWQLARDRGVIDDSIPRRKDAVRDQLRQSGLEPIWTEMQGVAYGPRILDADPFPGALQALEQFRQFGWTLSIISHKTKTPFVGAPHDLHAAARRWLAVHRFVDNPTTNLTADSVYLELTKQEKLQRIARTGCDWFIDDLPEFLCDPGFPIGVRRVLFDPHRQFSSHPDLILLHDWRDAVPLLTQENVA